MSLNSSSTLKSSSSSTPFFPGLFLAFDFGISNSSKSGSQFSSSSTLSQSSTSSSASSSSSSSPVVLFEADPAFPFFATGVSISSSSLISSSSSSSNCFFDLVEDFFSGSWDSFFVFSKDFFPLSDLLVIFSGLVGVNFNE